MSKKRIYAEINLKNVLKNMESFKHNIKDDTKIICVIKANGYGHGAVELANVLKDIDYLYGFAVATSEEAFELRNAGINNNILVLGYTFKEDYEEIIKKDIAVALFTEEMLEELNETARNLNKKAIAHIKVDTGMSRIGIRPDESGLDFVKKADAKEYVQLEGIFTHFARADEINKEKALMQLKKFTDFNNLLKNHNININIKHCSNSAGIIEMKDANFDVVRAGITLYGLWPSNEVRKDIVPIYPVMSLKSSIVYIKDLEPGREISYGGTFVTQKPMKVATVSAGYADGIPRGLSNKGYVLVRGKKAPIIGRVCMDQLMIDVTDIKDASVLDEVVFIGTQDGETITAEEVGDISGRFNYELVCDITNRVPRIYETN